MNEIKLDLKKDNHFIKYIFYHSKSSSKVVPIISKLEINEICFRVFLNNNRKILTVSVENYCQMALL